MILNIMQHICNLGVWYFIFFYVALLFATLSLLAITESVVVFWICAFIDIAILLTYIF